VLVAVLDVETVEFAGEVSGLAPAGRPSSHIGSRGASLRRLALCAARWIRRVTPEPRLRDSLALINFATNRRRVELLASEKHSLRFHRAHL
jgi:hypothetical protein